MNLKNYWDANGIESPINSLLNADEDYAFSAVVAATESPNVEVLIHYEGVIVVAINCWEGWYDRQDTNPLG